MIKFNDQSTSEKVRMGYWLLKLLPRDSETKIKNKDQPTIIENNKKI